ncbi:SRPBCC family protein [Paenibacillus puldeungensis]|uniref:SRPBCC family protein n=1 Tax=Paenibacillus puldeungensis TaxID=696536 RepID=A0ABW3RW30_9BACL
MTPIVGKNEVINSRKFDFPLELVFKAWTTPEQLARWWGPKGFTNTFEEFEFTPGGHWRFVMHGPNGVDYPNHSVFEEIVPLERIVIRHLNTPEFLLTATFEGIDGVTKVTWRQQFMKSAAFNQAKSFLAEANEQNLDRLNDLLSECSG